MVQSAFQPDRDPLRFLPRQLHPATPEGARPGGARPGVNPSGGSGNNRSPQASPRRVQVRPHREASDPRVRVYLQHADLVDDLDQPRWEIVSVDVLV